MGLNIQEFTSKINSTGILRKNFFYVNINLPGSILNQADQAHLRLLCFGGTLPGVFYATKNAYSRYGFGRKEKYPTTPIFDDISFSFYMDNKGLINNIFNTWMNSISNFNANNMNNAGGWYELSYKKQNNNSNYVTNIDIYMVNEQGSEILQYTLFDAWPISTDNIALNWSDNDSLAQQNIKFTYKDWTSKTFSSDPTNLNQLSKFADSGLSTISQFTNNFNLPQSIGDIQNLIFNKSIFQNGLNINLDTAQSFLNFI